MAQQKLHYSRNLLGLAQTLDRQSLFKGLAGLITQHKHTRINHVLDFANSSQRNARFPRRKIGIGQERTRRGIGAGIALRLQSSVVTVHVLDIQADTPKNQDVENPIYFHRVDVANETGVDQAFEEIYSLSNRLDYLVCCAAFFTPTPFLETEPEAWQQALQVNLTGAFLSCRAALRHMRPHKFGRVVLFSSMIARTGAIGGTHYATSKGGILGLARAVALEAAADDVRVNTISPGITDTPQLHPPVMTATRPVCSPSLII